MDEEEIARKRGGECRARRERRGLCRGSSPGAGSLSNGSDRDLKQTSRRSARFSSQPSVAGKRARRGQGLHPAQGTLRTDLESSEYYEGNI